MLTDANSNNLMQTKAYTVASCSDLQTGHLRLAAYNLAFFSLLGFLIETLFPSRKTHSHSPSHTVKDRETRGQKSRSDYRISASLLSSIKSRSTRESLTCRALHRGGANNTKNSKNVNIFSQIFLSFLQTTLKNLENQRFFPRDFFTIGR